MSSYHKIAYIYARTFYLYLEPKKNLTAVYKQVNTIIETSEKEGKRMWRILKNPILKTEEAVFFLSEIFKKKSIDKDLLAFLVFIVRKKRRTYILPILRAFIRIYRKAKHIVFVQLITANMLEKKQINTIIKMIKEKIKAKEILLTQKTDESLCGGIIIRMENNVLDLSIKTQLQCVARQFFDMPD